MVKAIVGANWGDEGKGKITDMLAKEADIIVRFQGGSNAGHTIKNDYGKFALHMLPSGVFHSHTTSILGNGVALNIPFLMNELKALDPKRKEKYFTKIADGRYAINDEIKQCVEFKRHNLLKDPFEKGFDLILCRNVVIYFTEEAKDTLYRNFFASLKPGGILFVGATEAILNSRNMGYVNYKPFFYQHPL